MLIIRTKPVAEIIQAVSAALMASASAGAELPSVTVTAAATVAALHRTDIAVIFPPVLRCLPVATDMWIAFECRSPLERVRVDFAGPDAHRMINRGDKDFAVADLPSLGRAANGLDDPLGLGIIDHELEPDLRQQISRCIRRRDRSPRGPSGGRSLWLR